MIWGIPMKIKLNTIILVAVLLCFSGLFIALQLILFNKPFETFFWIIQDLIFLPINIIIVTLVIGSIYKTREKNSKLLKLNILINEFYSEAGNSLIIKLNGLMSNLDDIKNSVNNEKSIVDPQVNSEIMIENLTSIYALLEDKKHFVLGMFENGNILEHDIFTNMLLAVHHLLDELRIRPDLLNLEKDDILHIEYDIKRAYIQLVKEFVSYMKHLKIEYPYIHSIVIRKNIF